MAFLNNSGDIILDAVLTDEGRKRLALGDGTFKIAKFALGDDEIDYMLQNDIERTIKELSREYEWFNELEEGARRDAIINMHFNLGRFRFSGFKKALGHMELGDHDQAALEFLDSRWARQVKGRAIEVTDMIKTNTYV